MDPVRGRLPSRSFRRDRIAWAVGAVVMIVAFTAGWLLLHHRIALVSDSASQAQDDFRLAILAYDAVVDRPNGEKCDRARLVEHIQALSAEGFRPVTLTQVVGAYTGKGKLPARSVLLTFDLGLLSTYRSVDPILRRHGWPAVMFVDPAAPERKDNAFLFWDRLQRMLDSGMWEIGAHPYGITSVDANPDAPDRVAAAGAADSGAADPFIASRVSLEKHLRGCCVACAAARGGGTSAESLARAGGDAPAIPLRIVDDVLGVNTPEEDPGHLMRLRVRGSWSGHDLTDRLCELGLKSARAEQPRSQSSWTHGWVPGAGRCEVGRDELTLRGRGRSDVWCAGSRGITDWTLSAKVRCEADGFWIAQEAGITGGDYWRLGGTREALYLERNAPNAPPQVLARFPLESPSGDWHRLRMARRGAGVWVEWDGRALSPTLLPLSGRWHGKVGIIASSTNETDALHVREVSFAPCAYSLARISGKPTPTEVQALMERAPDIAGIAPPWLIQTARGFEEQPFDTVVQAMLSRRYGWELIPGVQPADAAYCRNDAWLASLLNRAAAAGWSGLHFDLGRTDPAVRAAWQEELRSAERLFHRRGLRLYVTSGDESRLARVP